MTDPPPVIYGLETHARALAALSTGDTDTIRFLVGTQSFRGEELRGSENQLHLVEYDEELNSTRKNVFSHPAGEIWHVACSSSNPLLFSTSYNQISGDTKSDIRTCLWKLPYEENPDSLTDDGVVRTLVKVADLGTAEHGDMKHTLFSSNEDSDEVVTLADSVFYLWDVTSADVNSARLKSQRGLEGKGNPRFTSGRWDPHHRSTQIATANDCSIRGWDLRSMQQTYFIDNAHGQLVRDLDFNPNRQYIIATCGDDCQTRFWDVRNVEKPLKSLDNHSHWVWSVRFNHYHDQLVLTASSDSRVILNSMPSISSEPYGKLLNDADLDDLDGDIGNDDFSADRQARASRSEDMEVLPDGVVRTYEEHEDSVYAVEWSPSDPWVFASLSYDGRLIISHVPRSEKYKILL